MVGSTMKINNGGYYKRRTEFLNDLGYHVLRFWNNEVLLQFNAVMDQIYKHAC
jgi:very-short-patch-repair endonuclease